MYMPALKSKCSFRKNILASCEPFFNISQKTRVGWAQAHEKCGTLKVTLSRKFVLLFFAELLKPILVNLFFFFCRVVKTYS